MAIFISYVSLPEGKDFKKTAIFSGGGIPAKTG